MHASVHSRAVPPVVRMRAVCETRACCMLARKKCFGPGAARGARASLLVHARMAHAWCTHAHAHARTCPLDKVPTGEPLAHTCCMHPWLGLVRPTPPHAQLCWDLHLPTEIPHASSLLWGLLAPNLLSAVASCWCCVLAAGGRCEFSPAPPIEQPCNFTSDT